MPWNPYMFGAGFAVTVVYLIGQFLYQQYRENHQQHRQDVVRRRRCNLCHGSLLDGRSIRQCENCPDFSYHTACRSQLQRRPNGVRECGNCRSILERENERDALCPVCHRQLLVGGDENELTNCQHCQKIYHSLCAEQLPLSFDGWGRVCCYCSRNII